MNPEEAVRAHLDVTDSGSGLLVPIHWGTFRLAPHPWAEPVERVLTAAEPTACRWRCRCPVSAIDTGSPLRVQPVVAADRLAWLECGHDETRGRSRTRR